MDYSTVNFTAHETSTNSSSSIGPLTIKDTVLIFICCINFLLGLPTHCYVMWLIVTEARSTVASRFFYLSLSVCEIGNCLSALLVLLSNLCLHLTVVHLFLQGLAITGRPLFHCLMCVERYLAVVHPVTFLKFKPLRYRVMCSAVVWIITLGSCLTCLFILILFNISVYSWFFSVQFFIFLSIQLFCCVSVLRALKQSGPGERGREREEENHMKRRAFYIILITTVSTVIAYIPLIFSGFYIIMAHRYVMESFLISTVCFVLCSFVQPGLFLHQAGKLPCLRSP